MYCFILIMYAISINADKLFSICLIFTALSHSRSLSPRSILCYLSDILLCFFNYFHSSSYLCSIFMSKLQSTPISICCYGSSLLFLTMFCLAAESAHHLYSLICSNLPCLYTTQHLFYDSYSSN